LYNTNTVICPLCGTRKAKRSCPALAQSICSVCCATKRITEIQCPRDCVYLVSAREHPPAVEVRRHQQDVALVVRALRDLNERQSRLFLLVARSLVSYQPLDLATLLDEDVADACTALASTLETAARGVIYDHRPASAAAERLVSNTLRPLLSKTTDAGVTENDFALVLRRIAETVDELASKDSASGRPFLDLLGRIVRAEPAPPEEEIGTPAPRLIVP
jgi:hypothetical protein